MVIRANRITPVRFENGGLYACLTAGLKVGCDLVEFLNVRKGERTMDTSTVRIVCASIAVLFLGIIVLRRKKSAD